MNSLLVKNLKYYKKIFLLIYFKYLSNCVKLYIFIKITL